MVATYVKLYRVVTDFGAGIAYINGLAENFQALYTDLAVEHGTVDVNIGPRGQISEPDRRVSLGHHSTRKIPRSTGSYQWQVLSPGLRQPRLFTPEAHISRVERQATGCLRFFLRGLTTFWCSTPVPQVTDTSTVRWVQTASYAASGAADEASILATSMELSGGDFIEADYNFNFTIYGT